MQSNSSQPDLDWSKVRENVKLLMISVVQMERSMTDGDSSVTTLTQSFASMVNHMRAIHDTLQTTSDCEQKVEALDHCQQMMDKIEESIVAFQFYDRMQQSLSHVSWGLKGLSELVENPQRLYNPFEWQSFQRDIRGRYSMESEKVMFDAILEGKTMEEAIQLALESDENQEDDIELF